jgi:hypothetical protein
MRARLRPSFVGTLRGVTLAVLGAGGMSASMFLYEPSVTLLVSALAIAGIGARAAWQAIRGAAVLDQAVTRVSVAAGLQKLPIPAAVESKVAPTLRPSAETAVSEFGD